MKRRLPREFFARDAAAVARDLLGRVLCRRLPDRRVLRGRLVEVEAYVGPEDRASHAWRGRTPRNVAMFEAGGIAYVFRVYGIHFCLNAVTGRQGFPAAVLLRAAESPIDGVSASGPGRLCRAFSVDASFDGASFVGPDLWLEPGDLAPDRAVQRTARIGVDYAGAWARRRLRFVVAGSPDASGPRRLR